MQEKRYYERESMLEITQQEYDAAIAKAKEEGYYMGRQYKDKYERLKKIMKAIACIAENETE